MNGNPELESQIHREDEGNKEEEERQAQIAAKVAAMLKDNPEGDPEAFRQVAEEEVAAGTKHD